MTWHVSVDCGNDVHVDFSLQLLLFQCIMNQYMNWKRVQTVDSYGGPEESELTEMTNQPLMALLKSPYFFLQLHLLL